MKKEIIKHLMSKGVSSKDAYEKGNLITKTSEGVFSRLFGRGQKQNPEIFKLECEKELRMRGLDLEAAKIGVEVYKSTLDFAYKVIQSTEKYGETLNQVILDKENSDQIRIKAIEANSKLEKEKFKFGSHIASCVAVIGVGILGILNSKKE